MNRPPRFATSGGDVLDVLKAEYTRLESIPGREYGNNPEASLLRWAHQEINEMRARLATIKMAVDE